MQNKIIPLIIVLISYISLAGCADKTPPVIDKSIINKASNGYHRFYAEEYQPVDTKGYVKKIDNFTIIFDPSASMTEAYMPSYKCIACHTEYQNSDYAQQHAIKYGGSEFAKKDKKHYAMECNSCHQNPSYSKFQFAKELSMGLNQSIPNLDYKGTIRTFGYPVYTNLHYGLVEHDNKKFLDYDKKGYNRALKKILDADGVSPLHLAIDATGRDWYDHEGKIAVIIISDGGDMGEREILAAEDLKARYGDRICIYTILIGNSPSGKRVMNRIALQGQCGISVSGDALLDHKKMENFVREVFLEKTAVDKDCDEDGDGVPDAVDECPGGSIPGVMVGDDGCWQLVLSADVLFDFDKVVLKPKGVRALKIVKNLLDKYKFLDLHISGHTDNFGSMDYNIKLSRQRAEAGRDHLVKHGIDPERLSIKWHSYTIPVATNDNATGRALNRRLEFKFNKRQK